MDFGRLVYLAHLRILESGECLQLYDTEGVNGEPVRPVLALNAGDVVARTTLRTLELPILVFPLHVYINRNITMDSREYSK